MTQALLISQPDAAATLTKAVLRVAERFGLSQRELAAVLGLSEASASRLAAGKRHMDVHGKEGEFGLYLVRIARSLDALVGGDREQARQWLDADNHHLASPPRALLATIGGLVHVAEYLDAMRGRL
jgi:transcriptional regulator with XRE-family HTH domain